jgi:hypothetical protein
MYRSLGSAVSVLACCVALSACGAGGSDSNGTDTAQASSSSASAGVIDRSSTTTTTSSPTTTGTSNTPAVPSSGTSSPAVAANTSAPSTPSSSPAATPAAFVAKKSISHWATCDGQTDDSAEVAQAFLAASGGSFTLVIDCPVRLHIASDIAKPIFVDNDTTVQVTGSGVFIVDNVLQPAFVVAGSQNVTLTDWKVEYVGGLPVQPDVSGYERNGQFVQQSGTAQPAAAFNNLTLTPWLATHRHIIFQHGITAEWDGPSNASAVFFVTGDVSNLTVTGMSLYVPASAGGNRFVPMAFSLTQNFKANQTVTSTTPATADYRAVPHGLVFSNIDLDGTYMGWQGTIQNATFTNIESHRYGDLQDANGQNVGGVGKWFAPPHLFYLNYNEAGDSRLFTQNVSITNVVDEGVRVGVARDQGGSDTVSGYALSLKLGCVSCQVNGYQSSRPDGFLDLLTSNQLTIQNVSATYDSSFLNNIYPGWRFPSAAASVNVTVQNVTLADKAAVTLYHPIGNAAQPGNQNIVLKNVTVAVNRWGGSGTIVPSFAGQGNDVSAQYTMQTTRSRLMFASKGGVALTLGAQPDAIAMNQSTILAWGSPSASGCTASGSWAGAVASVGSRTYKPGASGAAAFSLGCKGASGTATVTLPLSVQ